MTAAGRMAGKGIMKFSYVLPDPSAYRDWNEFDGDLAAMRQAGYDAVELQIADPALFDDDRVRRSLQRVGYTMCAFQTGSTYDSRGNCLCTADETVRRRTIALLKSFVELAAQWDALIVFGSLQGRHSDEPDVTAGAARIVEAMRDVGQYASEKNVTLAFEPVNHGEVGFHNTIFQRPIETYSAPDIGRRQHSSANWRVSAIEDIARWACTTPADLAASPWHSA